MHRPLPPHTQRFATLPNYENAEALPTVHVTDLDETSFRERFVQRGMACHIKGAVAHWPAVAKWQSVDYLKQRSGRAPVLYETRNQYADFRRRASARRRKELIDRQKADPGTHKATFAEYLDIVHGHAQGHHLVNDLALGGVLSNLWADIAGFTFHKPRRKLTRSGYIPWGLYVFKESYTDWHTHTGADAVMCQVVNSKEIVLIAPDKQSWQAFVPAVGSCLRLEDIEQAHFSDYGALRPFRATVEPGDGVYIPVHWYHAVSAVDTAPGITVAAWFDAPLRVSCDPRHPESMLEVRELYDRLGPVRFLPMLPLLAWGFSWSGLCLLGDKLRGTRFPSGGRPFD